MNHKEAIRTWGLIYLIVLLIILGAFIGRPKPEQNNNPVPGATKTNQQNGQ